MVGYRCLSLMRASSVVKRQSTPPPVALRAVCHAATSRCRVARSASRRSRHCSASTASSISAMFSQLPCLGVSCSSSRSASRLASAGGNASYSDAGVWVFGVVLHQHDPLGLGVVDIQQVLDAVRPVDAGAPRADHDVAPASKRLTDQEQVAHPAALVLVVLPCWTPRGDRAGRGHLPKQLAAGLVQADLRTARIIGPGVHLQHVLHPPAELGVLLWQDAPAFLQPRLEPVCFKPNLRGLGWLISCLRCAYDCDTPRYVTTKVVAFRWSMCFDCAMGRRSGRMHVDQAGRHYTTVGGERRSYPTYLLRRSYRDERGRPRKETLANLTGLPEESIAALRATLKGRTLVDAEAAFAVERSVPHGNVAAAHVMASRLGLQGLLGPACRERDIAYALIVSRAVRPESELSTARWWQAGDTTLGTDLGVANASTDDVYAAMDWLVARQREVEKQLAARHLAEGGIAMFDLSSSWVEGSHCALAGFGHSRDGKRGRRQVEYGLLTDRQGRPVAVEVFPGNTSDPEST